MTINGNQGARVARLSPTAESAVRSGGVVMWSISGASKPVAGWCSLNHHELRSRSASPTRTLLPSSPTRQPSTGAGYAHDRGLTRPNFTFDDPLAPVFRGCKRGDEFRF